MRDERLTVPVNSSRLESHAKPEGCEAASAVKTHSNRHAFDGEMRCLRFSFFVTHKLTVGILLAFFEVVSKFIVISSLVQPDMSNCLEARGVIQGACRNVYIGLSACIPEQAAATFCAKPAMDIGRLVFDRTVPFEAVLVPKF